jgi:putative flippase GtrA
VQRLQQAGPETRRVAKFAVVGVGNTIVTLVSYAILLALGVNYLIAAPVAWALGLLSGYTWNRIWTFDRAEHQMSLMAQYYAVGLLGLALNTGLLALLVSVAGFSELPAELVVLPAVVLTTFAVNRYWVFRHHVGQD